MFGAGYYTIFHLHGKGSTFTTMPPHAERKVIYWEHHGK